MTLKDLKNILDKMSDHELNQELIYNSADSYLSGPVTGLVKAEENLYYNSEDDPSPLYTKKQLLDEGYDEEDIDGLEIEVPKGYYYISF